MSYWVVNLLHPHHHGSQKITCWLQTETALMYDAVKLFVLAIGALDNSTTVTISQLRCEGEQAWEHGNSLINYMKLVSVR